MAVPFPAPIPSMKWLNSNVKITILIQSLGVTFTQVGRWLTKHDYNVEPSQYGPSKYGLERVGKKALTNETVQKALDNLKNKKDQPK